MEFVEGAPLKGPLPLDEVLRLGQLTAMRFVLTLGASSDSRTAAMSRDFWDYGQSSGRAAHAIRSWGFPKAVIHMSGEFYKPFPKMV
jgi:hypothetical protein